MADSTVVDDLVALISRSLFMAFLRGADAWARLNVTMPQMKVLMQLGLHGGLPVSTLAAQMQVSPPNVTGILDRLEQHGWVRRTNDPNVRRVVRVVLTAEGQAFLDGLQQAGEERTRARLKEMRPEDRQALRQGMRALLGVIVAAPDDETSPQRMRAAG
ncbi:MAG: MarR family transcriptional regulator [Chloroflexota bacterium]|nr:MarR family transcriptional regulator [Chloroflexota bacterium]